MKSSDIQKLIDATPDGGTCVVPAGDLEIDVAIRLSRGITLKGADGFQTRITSPLTEAFVGSPSETVTGFHFDYSPGEWNIHGNTIVSADSTQRKETK